MRNMLTMGNYVAALNCQKNKIVDSSKQYSEREFHHLHLTYYTVLLLQISMNVFEKDIKLKCERDFIFCIEDSLT